MNGERWAQIERRYHEAAARPTGERAAFLAEACAGDEGLRREVESLLAQAASIDGPLDEGALAAAANVARARGTAALTGRRVGVYQVLAPLGAGGMGEVYRARDTKLGRDVAIKVLPKVFVSDPDRFARFEREARMLAALNHPHVGAIYGVEEADGIPALVLELVEGPTLADRLATGPILLAESLTIARQIADALDSAHEKGIVHRDLKPANIKITPDGVVKVLDFGLAKAGVGSGSDLTQSPTITVGGTHDGTLLGTAAYMSPEQARGQAVDKRTDIWAFGCVLYEMLTGQPAFGRETLSDTLAAILERQPDLDRLPPGTPTLVRRIVVRCLEKDRRQRARDIADVAVDLQNSSDTAASPPSAQRSGWQVLATVTALAVVAALGFAGLLWRGSRPVEQPPQFSRMVRFTRGPAHEFGPAISPDGKWVAYLSDTRGPVDVWIQSVSGGEPVNLTAASGLDIATTTGISGLEVAPDGTRVAVMAKPHGSPGLFSTWEMPAPFAGVPHKLLDDGFLGMRWSPDGQHVTFIRAGPSEGDALWVADGDGTNRREIVHASGGIHIHWPAWAGDGFIYFNRMASYSANIDRSEIYRVRTDGSGLEAWVSTLRRAMFPLPLADGALVYAANPTTAEFGLWWKSPRRPDPVRLTTGIGEYAEPRMSADGRWLVATLYDLRQSIIRVPIAPTSPATPEPITDGTGGDLDPTITPTGNRMLFSSSRSGDRHIWTSRLDGTDLRPLTSGSSVDERPAISPDGTSVAFVSDRGGAPSVWLLSAEGGTPQKASDLSPLGQLTWSRDSRHVVFAASVGPGAGLWSVTTADGAARRIPTTGAAADPSWSPTRDVIAYLEPASSGPANVKLAFVSPEGKRLYESLPPAPMVSAGFANGSVAWSPDGKTVAIVSQNTNLPAMIWMIAPDDARPAYRKVLELPLGPRIRGITWTADGSALIVGKHDSASDIVLMDSGAAVAASASGR